MSYDKNGNIQTLERNGGINAGLPNPIDDLIYTYDTNNKNLLKKVVDNSISPQGFKDDIDSNNPNDINNDYLYDANGNMTKDENKGITNIEYNHLNLPTKILVGTNTIEYLYNATGQKVSKIVTEASIVNKTDYLAGGFQYKNNVLQFFSHPEGYVNVIDSQGVSNFNYVFNYTDHLGNIRLSYGVDPSNGTLKTIEENHYYPFGLKHTNYNSDLLLYTKGTSGSITLKKQAPSAIPNYFFKFNGKELQTELGLDLYDYGARNYDPAIGRFFNRDKFSEKYYDKSSYSYTANNPIVFNDINGDSILIYSKQDKANILYENGNLYSKNTESGEWETYNGKNVKVDKNGNKSIKGFLGKVTAALDKIRTGGESGSELVTALQNDDRFMSISQGSNATTGFRVSWNPSNSIGGPNQEGSCKRPSYIGLAHELAHAWDNTDGMFLRNSIGKIGDENITGAEFFAMDWENRIRKENSLPLRTHYGNDESGNVIGEAYIGRTYTIFQTQVTSTPNGIEFKSTSSTSTMILPVK